MIDDLYFSVTLKVLERKYRLRDWINVGLVQPIANWAKRDEPNSGGRPAYRGGWWIMVFPVAGPVRGHSSPIRCSLSVAFS